MKSRSGARQARPAVPDLPGLLVDPSWLAERLGRPGLRIFDLRDSDTYRSGHIPGASHLELAELGSSVAGLESALLPPAEFADLMAGHGLSRGDAVVAYDDQWGLAAARLVWALHRYGHESVALLDGGWDRWRDEGRPVADGASASAGPEGVGPHPVASGRFEPTPRADVFADTSWIEGRIADGDALLLDTRTQAEFDQGHLPGAVLWDWFNAVPEGSWNVSRDREELLAEWRALGVDPSKEVAVYCRSGMRAAHTYVVLRNAGFPRVRLYDGSWQAWSMRGEGADGG